MEQQNPYQAPRAAIATVGGGETRMFSPTQTAVACYLGGPLAGVYMMRENFKALDNAEGARKTVLYGGLLTLAIIAILPFLPEKTPNMLIPLSYTLVARYLVETHQLKKEAIEQSGLYSFQSNWRVAGVSVVALIPFMALGIAVTYMFR